MTPNDHEPHRPPDPAEPEPLVPPPSGRVTPAFAPPPPPEPPIAPPAAPAAPVGSPAAPAQPATPTPPSWQRSTASPRWGSSPGSESWGRPSASGESGQATPQVPTPPPFPGAPIPPVAPESSVPHVAPAPTPTEVTATPVTPRWVVPLVIMAGLALFVGGALAGWALAQRDSEDSPAAPVTDADAPTTPVTTGAGGGLVPSGVDEPVAAVAQAVAPSVVQIDTNFGLGSGIIMDDEGHILTAAHVIEGASQVRVRLADGTMVPATIVGTSPETDVGVVHVEPRPEMVPAVLGVDAEIQVGQLAVAVGSPFGLEQTVTSGIVSALDRPVETQPTFRVGMIQTDASINPGNSGGALADRHGRVIGINDAIRTQGGGNEGVGFAIPIDLAASIAERLIAGESIRSGFLGVSANDAIEGRPGAVVQEVTPGTPAAEVGIEVGDLIVSVDGQSVRSVQELRARILAISPGTPVIVEVVRDGSLMQFEVVLAANLQ